MDKFICNNNTGGLCAKGFVRNPSHMLPVTDWLADLPEGICESDLVEVQFKNTRKGYYHNAAGLPLEKGTIVAVDAAPGHDIGEVTLTGVLVEKQMKKYRIDLSRYTIRDIFRIATEIDLIKCDEAKSHEHETMIKARLIAKSLGLEMKIGDVEYQGDGTKAIFYYIADGRVDFRQLIKIYAETFRVRIEMKQIGARQEAGRIGGTGPCGRELCCSTWMTNFHSVGTGAARVQNLSLAPQKLAGQCAKLKCCLNYETDCYEEATAALPPRDITLFTVNSEYFFFSADPLAGKVTYSTDRQTPVNLETLTIEQAKKVIEMNKRGDKPLNLGGEQTSAKVTEVAYQNAAGQGSLTRFDKQKSAQQARSQQRGERENRPPREPRRSRYHGDSDGFTNRRS